MPGGSRFFGIVIRMYFGAKDRSTGVDKVNVESENHSSPAVDFCPDVLYSLVTGKRIGELESAY